MFVHVFYAPCAKASKGSSGQKRHKLHNRYLCHQVSRGYRATLTGKVGQTLHTIVKTLHSMRTTITKSYTYNMFE